MKNTPRPDGLIRSKIYLGDGKYKYVFAHNNKELEKKVAEQKLKLGKGIDLTKERDTFRYWADSWLSFKKIKVSNGRYNTYSYRRNNLAPLDSMMLSKMTMQDVQSVIVDIASKNNPHTGKPYSAKTLAEVKQVAVQIVQLAIANRVVDYNFAKDVVLPDGRPSETRRALTADEQQWIINTPHRAQTAAMIMMYAGLRRGELIPLMWSDVDLNEGTINVRQFVEIIGGKSVIKPYGKSSSASRIVYMPQCLADYLKTVKHTSLYVCPSAKGTLMSESAFKRLWESYLCELNYRWGDFSGLYDLESGGPYKKPDSKNAPEKVPFVIPRITAHWLRHTFITSYVFCTVHQDECICLQLW